MPNAPGFRDQNWYQQGPADRHTTGDVARWLSGPAGDTYVYLRSYANGSWTIPGVAGEWNTGYRTFADLSAAETLRWGVMVAGAANAGATLRLQYTTNTAGTSGWTDVTGSDINVGSTGYKISSWITIPALARNLVLLRFVGLGGTGPSATLGSVTVVFRSATT